MTTSRVNINSAGLETLARLPGIGETLAERIIAYREQQRPFADVVELVEVEGISIHMVNDISDRITTGREGEEAPPAGDPIASPVLPSALQTPDAPSPGQSANGREQPPAAEEATEQAVEQPPIVLAMPEQEPEREPEPIEQPAAAAQRVPCSAAAGAAPTARPEQPTPVVAVTRESRPARSPLLFWGYLLSAAAGALMGAVLALFFLLAVNGTLTFADQAQVASSQQRTAAELQALTAEQDDLATQISTMTGQVEIARSQAATLTVQLATVASQQSALDGDLQGIGEAVATLTAETGRFSEELDALSAAAAGFERFLDGMRGLLLSLEETPGATTVTPTSSPTPTGTPDAAGTQTPATSTPMPTRTPRPSATPFGP